MQSACYQFFSEQFASDQFISNTAFNPFVLNVLKSTWIEHIYWYRNNLITNDVFVFLIVGKSIFGCFIFIKIKIPLQSQGFQSDKYKIPINFCELLIIHTANLIRRPKNYSLESTKGKGIALNLVQ